MPVFGYQDVAKEIARLQRREVDFGLLQDKIDEHRDRVPRGRRSASPSPEKQQDLKAESQPANPMPGFKPNNGIDKSQARTSATAQQREVPPERSTTADTVQTKPVPTAAVPHVPQIALQPDVGSFTRPRSTQKDTTSQEQEQEKADGQDRQEEDEETEEEEQHTGSRYATSDIVTDNDASDDESRRTPRWQLRPRTERPPGPQLTPSPSPSPDPLPLPTVQLEDRDWAVIGITDARKEFGFTEYRTIWGSTRHALPTLQANEEGVYQVAVGGRVCDIESLDRLPVLGDHTNIKVRWKCQWLMTWELSDARKEVVEFNLRRNEGVTADPDYLKSYCAPEPEARSTTRCSLVHESRFKPDPTGDYTTSLMQHCAHRSKSEENSSGLSINILRGLLDELPRQRLVLRSQWRVEKDSIRIEEVIKIPRWDGFLRICMVYVVGQARKQECSFCADTLGPFRKCVTKGGNFEGACVNCSLLGRKQDCEYHQSRWIEADQMLHTLDAQEIQGDPNHEAGDALPDDEPIVPSSPAKVSASARNSALLTPPASSPNMNASTTNALELPDDQNIDMNVLVDGVCAQLDGLGGDQSLLQHSSSDRELRSECNASATDHEQEHVNGHAPSQACDLSQKEVTEHETSSSPPPTPAREYSVPTAALPEKKENPGPSTEHRGTKRRRSVVAESMPQRQQPSRKHKAVRTSESTDCESKIRACNTKAPKAQAWESKEHEAASSNSSSAHNGLHQSSKVDLMPAKAESSKVLVHLPASKRKADPISPERNGMPIRQQTDSAPLPAPPSQQEDELPPKHVPHAECNPSGTCVDPILNPMPLKTEPELSFESVIIYSDRECAFTRGELTDAEVRYLLSIAPCDQIDLFEQGWQDYNEELRTLNLINEKKHRGRTKEHYLSWVWSKELNVIMRTKCPRHPDNVNKPVIIDLTMDDD